MSLLTALALVVACGGAASPGTQIVEKEVIKEVEVVKEVEVIKEVAGKDVIKEVEKIVVATPVPGAAPGESSPVGTLNVGQKELGIFMGHPRLAGNPQVFVQGTAPIGESLMTVSADLEVIGMLAKSWEVSDDGLIWTFHLNEGVQFHKGYGEMTAEDVIWSFQQLSLIHI